MGFYTLQELHSSIPADSIVLAARGILDGTELGKHHLPELILRKEPNPNPIAKKEKTERFPILFH